ASTTRRAATTWWGATRSTRVAPRWREPRLPARARGREGAPGWRGLPARDHLQQGRDASRGRLHRQQRLLAHALGGQRPGALDEGLEVCRLRVGREVVRDPGALSAAGVTPVGVEALPALADDAVEHVPEVARGHREVLGAGAEAGVLDRRLELGGELARRRLDHLRPDDADAEHEGERDCGLEHGPLHGPTSHGARGAHWFGGASMTKAPSASASGASSASPAG